MLYVLLQVLYNNKNNLINTNSSISIIVRMCTIAIVHFQYSQLGMH